MSICMCKCSAHGDPKRTLAALELELQVIASHPTGVLGSILGLQKNCCNHLLRPNLKSKVCFFFFYAQKKHLISLDPKVP